MLYSLTAVAFAALALATPVPQGVAEAIAPKTAAPEGCKPDYSGEFQIQVVNVTSLKQKRQSGGPLVLTLSGGVLKDAKGRTGYIAANRQFQFDAPAQTGAIYTAGWSICPNGSLAIGGDAVFKQCLSGTFYNLYDEAEEAQCSPVYIDTIGAGSSASPAASNKPDGQPTSAAGVSQIADGQPQADTSADPVSQIHDGQIQATNDPAPAAAPVSQIHDGQIQATNDPAPAAASVSQIGDGQIQATTSTPATPVSPISQIGDGQIQAHPGAAAPTRAPVSQIPDGQIQTPTNGTIAPRPTVTPYTGAASLPVFRGELFAAAAGLLVLMSF